MLNYGCTFYAGARYTPENKVYVYSNSGLSNGATSIQAHQLRFRITGKLKFFKVKTL